MNAVGDKSCHQPLSNRMLDHRRDVRERDAMQITPDPRTPAMGEAVSPAEGFSVQALAAQQVQHVVVATTNFVSTLIFLLSSALALVAALAWNKAISDWLPTVRIFDLTDPLAKDFAYAGVATAFAVVIISILGFINGRLKGKNLLVQQPSK
jgi:uncharacterized membrane protein YidH (DUF202 family)